VKVHLTTLGCPKNQVDSELMLGMLAAAGFPAADRAEDAECLIVNTCAFIDRARQESVDTILELARLKDGGACRSLIVTGCLTQRYGAEVLQEIPEVDGILGTSGLHRVVDLVRQAAGRHDWATSAPPGYLYDAATPRLLAARLPYAYVKIAEGCDMGCTFCAIPQFRGRHRSRPLGDIAREVEGLGARGIQEVVLVSQDTLAYGRDLPGNGDIGDLLLALGETRMPWIRPMYLHPAHVSDRLVEKWSRARVVPYLDMPIQHADDAILKAMRRAVTARRMREIVAAFRQAVPGVTVRTTVLLGFPGETEASVERLLEFLEEVRVDRLGTFTYSPEEGTPSPSYADQVPPEVAAERAARIQECQDRIAWELNEKRLGSEVEVLVDGPSEDPAFAFEGRTAGQAPEIDGVVYLRDAPAPPRRAAGGARSASSGSPAGGGRRLARPGRFTPGHFARVRIVEVEGHELIGERV
jgi:ribosomal protein S12 methylthiotransferase